MKDFFIGWRRKVGVITLGLACLMFAAWIRSLIVYDEVWFTFLDRNHLVSVPEGGFVWVSWDARGDLQLNWDIGSPQSESTQGMDRVSIAKSWRDHFEPQHRSPRIWTANYLTLVVLFSLLSAFLILWKPRKRA